MADPQEAQYEVYEALCRHFDRSDEYVNVEQIVEMTALDESSVINALRVLDQAGRIEGVTAAEIKYPFQITSIYYD